MSADVGWDLRVPLSAIRQRYDETGSFISRTYFICKILSSADTDACELHSMVYSSYPIQGREYDGFPLGSRGGVWNLDRVFKGDVNTCTSVTAALQGTDAVIGCYISTDVHSSVNLSGASLGLAVTMAVMGISVGSRAPVVFTGWMSSFGDDSSERYVGPVDSVMCKVNWCQTNEHALFIPLLSVKRDPALAETYRAKQFYDYAKFMKHVPFSLRTYRAIVVDNVAEAQVMAMALLGVPSSTYL